MCRSLDQLRSLESAVLHSGAFTQHLLQRCRQRIEGKKLIFVLDEPQIRTKTCRGAFLGEGGRDLQLCLNVICGTSIMAEQFHHRDASTVECRRQRCRQQSNLEFR